MMWKESYRVGIETVDEQHRELFQRVSDFLQAIKGNRPWEQKIDRVKETMTFMQSYVVEHFANEEVYQRKINYPAADEHHKHHEDFKADVFKYAHKMEDEDYPEELSQEFAGKLMAWLIYHVAREDQKMGEFVRKNIEVIKPFVQATQDVFKQMLNLEAKEKEIVEINDLYEGKEVNALIGVIGDLTGSVMFSYSKPTALTIVKSMSGMEFEKIDVFVTSALGEVGNIISGNAVSYLASANYRCDITSPQVILGKNQSISLACKEAYVVTIGTEIGDFNLNIALTKR